MGRVEKFDKDEGEHNLKVLDMTHKFALKMASMISVSVVSIVVILAVFLGTVTITALVILGIIAIIFGILSFSITRSALM